MRMIGSTGGLEGRLFRSTVLISAVLVLSAAEPLSQSAPEGRPTDGDEAVRWISRCLNRMGENDIAKSLLTDRFGSTSSNPSDPANVFYAANRKVRIAKLGSSTDTGVNAETGYDRGAGQNVLTLDVSVLTLADSRKLMAKRPYHPNASGLFEWMITVFHEYVHMRQKDPKMRPADEDPAYHAVNKAMLKWFGRIESEFQALSREVPSDEKGVKLLELDDLARSLKSAYGPHFEAIDRNVRDQLLTKGQTWEVPGASSKDTNDLLGSANSALLLLIKKIETEIEVNAKSSLKGATAKAAAEKEEPLPVALRFARIRWTAEGQGRISKKGAPFVAMEIVESGGLGPDVQIPLHLLGNRFSGTLEIKKNDITRQISFSGELDRDLSAVRNLKVSSWTTHIWSDREGDYDIRDEWTFVAPKLSASKTMTKADRGIKSLRFYLPIWGEKDVKGFRYHYSNQSVEKTLTSIESMGLQVNLDPDVLPK